MNDQNIVFCYTPYVKTRKIVKYKSIHFDECSKYFLMIPVLLKEYNLFSQNTESSLDQ